MNEADDEFLQALNQSRSQANGNGGKDGDARCTEDQFEEVMSFFDETSQTRQPFAAVDNPPVVSLEDMEASCDDTISLDARIWIKDIYPHWQTLRLETGNRPLMPALKIETGQETDDADAYVCFRRREVRQARKTRGRDAQVVEKLKKLRREVEEARQLVRFVVKRERLTRERIETERKVFEQRSELKRVKIQQGIKGDKGDDEDLLVNQRVSSEADLFSWHVLTRGSPSPSRSPSQMLRNSVRLLSVSARAVLRVGLLKMISSSCRTFMRRLQP